jgi:hypothetical protein
MKCILCNCTAREISCCAAFCAPEGCINIITASWLLNASLELGLSEHHVWRALHCEVAVRLPVEPSSLAGHCRYDEFGRVKRKNRGGDDRRSREEAALARLRGQIGHTFWLLLPHVLIVQ